MAQPFSRRHVPSLALVAAALVLSACASGPQANEPGRVRVQYTRDTLDGARLKEIPTEVKLVQRATTHKEVGKQVALNVFMLAMGGGVAASPFSKSDLAGERIEGPTDRANLRNPVSTDFVTRLDQRIREAIQADAALAQRAWRQPVLVSDGFARLVYEQLDGAQEERLRLVTRLVVYKTRENASLLSMQRAPQVDCSGQSEPALALADWAQQDFRRVKDTLDAQLAACERKVLAALPDLLRE
jgi:hypothetical protein